jgi:hypothetical protein
MDVMMQQTALIHKLIQNVLLNIVIEPNLKLAVFCTSKDNVL